MHPRLEHDKLLAEMNLSLLVVTPQPRFGELLSQILLKKLSCEIKIVDDKAAALDEIQRQNFTHALIDTDIKNEIVLDLGQILREANADIRLVIISDSQTIPTFEALRPWSLLSKPFDIPDLLRILDDEIEQEHPSLPESSNGEGKNLVEDSESLPWLQDVSKAAQHLTRLTLESSAQATLIIRNRKMWSYAGQLLESATSELVQVVNEDKITGDLLKFLRLDATKAEHMLYATQLGENINLAMVFDAETPFSAIRHQATHLADSLEFSLQEATPTLPSEKSSSQKTETEDFLDIFDFEGEDGDLSQFSNISDILENIPNPNPFSASTEGKTSTLREELTANGQMHSPKTETRPSTPVKNSSVSPRKSPQVTSGRMLFQDEGPREVDLEATQVQESRSKYDLDLEVTRVGKTNRPETPLHNPGSDELDVTRPHSRSRAAGLVNLQPASPGMYDLTYACLLIPRFGSHHLTGDLAVRISEWIPNICIAYGWRLEYISVRPDYLQWVVNVPPSSSPGHLMRVMRKQTSEKIFEDFLRLKKENPSGDFWAPGYLIMGGSQPHPSKLVKDYIQSTRERQGS